MTSYRLLRFQVRSTAFFLFLSAGALFNGLASAQNLPLEDLQLQLQRSAKAALLAEHGKLDGYAELKDSRERFAASLAALQKSANPEECNVHMPSAAQQEMASLLANWANFDRMVGVLLNGEAAMRRIRDAVKRINDAGPGLTEATQQLSALKAIEGSPARDISAAAMLVFLHIRIAKNANQLLLDDLADPEAAFLLNKDANSFRDIAQGLLNGSSQLHLTPAKGQSKNKLLEIIKQFDSDKSAVTAILADLKSLVAVKQALQYVLTFEVTLRQQLQHARQAEITWPAKLACPPANAVQ